MALIGKLKDTVIGTVHVARSAGQQLQRTAAPAAKQAARLVRSQVEQRRAPSPTAPPAESKTQPPDVPKAPPAAEPAEAPAPPTPAVVAKNIAPKPGQPKPAPKKKPAKKSAPGAKLPVKRASSKPDPA
jgi:hypothetical protein